MKFSESTAELRGPVILSLAKAHDVASLHTAVVFSKLDSEQQLQETVSLVKKIMLIFTSTAKTDRLLRTADSGVQHRRSIEASDDVYESDL